MMALGEPNRLMITDDRGSAFRVPWAQRERRRACFGTALQREVERREWAHRRFFGLKNTTVVVIGITPVLLSALVILFLHDSGSDAIRNSATGVSVAGMAVISAVGIAGRPKSVVVAVLLEHRRCPACMYDLTGCPIGEDACTMCPECGAAWRLGGDASGTGGATKSGGPERV